MSALSVYGSTTALFKSMVFAMIIARGGLPARLHGQGRRPGGRIGPPPSAVVSAMFYDHRGRRRLRAILFYYVW